MGWSVRRRATVVAALLACAGALGLVVAGGERGAEAAARPTLQIVSFTADSTIRPGRTTSATVSCRRGFALLGSRFRPISVNPANARPVFETVAVIPRPKGATFAFRNSGTATLQIRATADCTRIAGRPSLRTTVVRRAFRFGAATAEAGRARTSARRGLAVVCRRPNSIPADIGFDARSSDLRRLRFFVNRRGRIGLRGVFTGRPGGRGELLLSCVQGRGVRMVGRVAGSGRRGARRTAAQAGRRAQASARRPAIVVRYFRTAMRPRPGLPFGGMLAGVDRKRRVPWGSPMPSVSPAGFALTARGFLAGLRASSSTIVPTGSADGGRSVDPFNFIAWAMGDPSASPVEVSHVLAGGSELNRVILLAFADRRLLDEVKQELEEEGKLPPPPPSQGGSKTVGPFSGLPDCQSGFFIDIYIDADAQEPIEHRILDNDPPCENATVKVFKFDAGVEPPDTPEGETRWQSRKTYRVAIAGDPGPPKPFRIAVTWFKG